MNSVQIFFATIIAAVLWGFGFSAAVDWFCDRGHRPGLVAGLYIIATCAIGYFVSGL